MASNWTTWYLVLGSLLLLGAFGRLDLLALVLPVSAVVGFGAWIARRRTLRGRGR